MGNSSSRHGHTAAPASPSSPSSPGSGPAKRHPTEAEKELHHTAGNAEADVWRAEADKHAKLRNECFEKSKQAYSHGDKAKAKELSLEGKKHDQLMKEANKKAADVVFAAKNALVDPDSIDLHGLQVKEAIERTEARIAQCLEQKKEYLVIIVGRGNHSVGNIPKVKPAIQNLLKKYRNQLTVELDQPNAGCITVRFPPGGLAPKHKKKAAGACIIL